MKTRVILSACAILALASIAPAQDQPPSLRPSPSKTTSEPSTPVVLEIFYNSSLGPAYLKIEGPERKPHWIWFTKFSRLPGWQLPETQPPIRAVRVSSQWNGETADVRVTLLRGVRGFDQEELVDSYSVGLDETRLVRKLEAHGIEPFKIALRIPKAVAPPPPGIENRTQSIQLLEIDIESFPLPAYRVRFRNLSEKDLAALKVELFRDGASGLSSLFQGEEGSPRIESNASREEYIPANVPRKIADSFAPGSSAVNSIAVTSAVFTDGSFEGEVGPACMFESSVVGRRIGLKTVLKIIDEFLSQPDGESHAAQFKEKISALTYEFSEAEKATPSIVSKSCPNPALSSHLAIKGLKIQLLSELNPIITTRPKPLVTFRAWLELKKKNYQKWLKSLEAFRGSEAIASQSR